MILLLHISLSLISIIVAGIMYMNPSKNLLRVSYGLIAATLASGVVLMTGASDHMASSVVSGVVYLSIVSIATIGSQRKLAAIE